ncbi:MAG TPA: Rrf2 family transcriptional regulator [Gemmatimonadaceae bacterium]|nr:Rrf2 family transcriptional regulator [Gemmatimonadaceae bacterium]
MLSHTADYALRALLVLGRNYGQRSVRADEVADATGTPRNYTAKVLNGLAKAGVVSSLRGPSGGFALLQPPNSISLASIIDLFDEPHQHTKCLLGIRPCTPSEPCAAHHTWTAVMRARREPLTTITLGDLLGSEPAAFAESAGAPDAGAVATI